MSSFSSTKLELAALSTNLSFSQTPLPSEKLQSFSGVKNSYNLGTFAKSFSFL